MWKPTAYIRLDFAGDGRREPWLCLYDRAVQSLIGKPIPQVFFSCDDIADDYVEYVGEQDIEDDEP